ncbi:tyrosine-type recombinase/integrase [Amnibacterium endophyticum]|uniref:Tyrosine-type recombinase/integrase n=1 Tax=Amnibacterium endophyticum TaxID=2109337 RepID=A0ABW4LGQ0_9MICO
MAHVREVARKGGRAYEVRWKDAGRDRQRTFAQRRAADRFALRIENELAEGVSTAPLLRRQQIFREVAEASLAASRPRLKASTYAGYEQLYAAAVYPTFGARRLSAITGQDVEAWLASLIAAGREANTVRNHYVALHKVFRYALRHRLVAHDPCAGVDVPRPGTREDFAAVFLTPTQVEAIAADLDAHPPYGLVVRFAAGTGLRAAEVAGLRVRDVNLSAGHIEVRQTVRKVNGAWTTDTPKSARSTRNVPILSRALTAELRRYLLTHPASGDPDALFWPGRANGSRRLDWSRPMDVGGLRRYYLLPAAERAGLPHLRFHDLRHTFASLALAAGFQPVVVSRWMGHASVTTTDTVYGHLYPTDYAQQVDRFEAYVTASS